MDLTGTTQTLREDRESLRRNRDFLIFALGQTCSYLGNAVTRTTLPMVIVSSTGSGTAAALLSTLEQLPHLVLGIPAGALADRWPRKRMMSGADALRCGLLAAVPIAMSLGASVVPLLFMVVLPLSVLNVFFLAAFAAAMPSLVGGPRAAEASAYLNSLSSVAAIAGAALAGVLVSQLGAAAVLALDAVTFLVSAATITLIARPLSAAGQVGAATMLGDIKESLRFLHAHAPLRSAVLLAITTNAFMAPLLPTLACFLLRDSARPASFFGAAAAFSALGSALGGIAGGRLVRRRHGVVMATAQLLSGAAVIALLGCSSLPATAVVCTLIGAGTGLTQSVYLAIRAQLTPDQLLGRISSTARSAMFALGLVVAPAVGALADARGGAAALCSLGGALVLSAGLAFGSPPLRQIGLAAT